MVNVGVIHSLLKMLVFYDEYWCFFGSMLVVLGEHSCFMENAGVFCSMLVFNVLYNICGLLRMLVFFWCLM